MVLVLVALGIVTALILNNRNSKECMNNSMNPTWKNDIWPMFRDAGGEGCIDAMREQKDVKLRDENWVRKNAERILKALTSKGAQKMPPGNRWNDQERAKNISTFKKWAKL
jgi:hypothetical protein